VRSTLIAVIKSILREKNPNRSTKSLKEFIDQMNSPIGLIEDWLWKKTLTRIYNPQDMQQVFNRLNILKANRA
jgi:hypothetical protein